MKTVAVIFGGTELLDKPLNDPAFLQGYLELAQEMQKRGARLILTRGLVSYLGNQRFSSALVYKDGEFAPHTEPIEADVLYNKSAAFYPERHALVVNRKDFELLFTDKAYMASIFPHLFPKTYVAQRADQARAVAARLPGEMIVAKPLFGYGGEGVLIGPREDVLEKATGGPLLLQEFIDTSGGIPGITDSRSDLRVIVTGVERAHKIILMYARETASGKMVSNFSQGGTIQPIAPDQWPHGVQGLVEEVDRTFVQYGRRTYCLDCGRAPDGRWIIYEVNVPAGQMTRAECGTEADRYVSGLADLLIPTD